MTGPSEENPNTPVMTEKNIVRILPTL